MSILYDGVNYRLRITGTDAGTFGGVPGWVNGSQSSVTVPKTFEDPAEYIAQLRTEGQFVQFIITDLLDDPPPVGPTNFDFVSRWSPHGDINDGLANILEALGASEFDQLYADQILLDLGVTLPPSAGRIRILVAPALFTTRRLVGRTYKATIFGDEYRTPLAYGYLIPEGDPDYELDDVNAPRPRGYLYTCSRLNELFGQVKDQLDTKLNKGDNVLERDIVLVDGSIINVPPATEEGDIKPYGTGTD